MPGSFVVNRLPTKKPALNDVLETAAALLRAERDAVQPLDTARNRIPRDRAGLERSARADERPWHAHSPDSRAPAITSGGSE